MTQSRAQQEGWLLATSYGDEPEPEIRIERWDSPETDSGVPREPIFADDSAAWMHVVTCARAGSAYHRRALEACSTAEQERIIAHCGAWK